MEERRWTMDRKKSCAVLTALLMGIMLSAGKVWALAPAEITGYLMGDPAPGKLVPYFKVTSTLSTLIGFENAEEDKTLGSADHPEGEDVLVHVTIFNTRSVEVINFDLCLSPLDFGFIVLQKATPSAFQVAALNKVTGPHTTRASKARFLSLDNGDIPSEGYVTLRAISEFLTFDGTCGQGIGGNLEEFIPDAVSEPLATWAILQDVGTGFFATEIPTPTAVVAIGDPQHVILGAGQAFGGVGAYGLIPKGNRVLARFDINPLVLSHTDVFVWLTRNGHSSWPASLVCEDELAISTSIPLPNEVNVFNPDDLSGISQCKLDLQFRGILLFDLPETGFLWSQISQEGSHFRENFLGYNLECNTFIDPLCDDPLE
jgi:hypothetical protein